MLYNGTFQNPTQFLSPKYHVFKTRNVFIQKQECRLDILCGLENESSIQYYNSHCFIKVLSFKIWMIILYLPLAILGVISCWGRVLDRQFTPPSGFPTWHGVSYILYFKKKQAQISIVSSPICRRTMLQGKFDPCRRSLRFDQGGKFYCPWVLSMIRINYLQ